jgi:hypothetical protein
MQRAQSTQPWLIEICPASTLKRLNRYVAYKGKTGDHRAARSSIVRSLQRHSPIIVPAAIRSIVLDDPEGDALDSVIAALATFQAVHASHAALKRDAAYAIEGYVYT